MFFYNPVLKSKKCPVELSYCLVKSVPICDRITHLIAGVVFLQGGFYFCGVRKEINYIENT